MPLNLITFRAHQKCWSPGSPQAHVSSTSDLPDLGFEELFSFHKTGGQST